MKYWIIKFDEKILDGFIMWFMEFETMTGNCTLVADEKFARKFLTQNSAQRLILKLRTIYPNVWGESVCKYDMSVESREMQ